MRYVVMECCSSYAVLLDENGRFWKAANLRYEVGQTVSDPVLMREKTPETKPLIRWIASGAAAIAACLLLIFGIGYYQNYKVPYSSVYLSINPQVRIHLNRQGTVVDVVGTNPDGVALLEGYDGRGKDKVTVADELIDRAIDMGYLSEGGRVSFSIDTPEEALFTEYGIELRTGLADHLEGRITITISVFGEEEPEESSSPSSEKSEDSEPPASSWAGTHDSDYDSKDDDTDYDPHHDGITDYTPPVSGNSSAEDGDSGYDPSDSGGGDDEDEDNDDGDDEDEDEKDDD